MSVNVQANGVWHCELSDHSWDAKLGAEIAALLRERAIETVLDAGCGNGAYVRQWNEARLNAMGVDGNPRTPEFNSDCLVADLTVPLKLPMRFDAVVSLETGEHIPAEYEPMFVANVTAFAERCIVLSWFPREGEGIGHVNPRSNDYVAKAMDARGWLLDAGASQRLRTAATLWWFKESLMVFTK